MSLLTFLFEGGIMGLEEAKTESFSTGEGVMRERRGYAHGHSIRKMVRVGGLR